jgi:heat repeat domain protein
LNSYILNLEKEFSLIKNGFKEQEKRALADYKAKGAERCKELAYLAYSSKVYQVRMYAVFLFGHLLDDE